MPLHIYRNYNWNNCPQGTFLQGLYRSGDSKLYNIEYGRCCKPANHPYWYGHCYEQDVTSSFDNQGTSKCNDGYFITGLYRGSCDKLYCIEKFRCCKMYPSKSMARGLFPHGPVAEIFVEIYENISFVTS